MGYRSDVSVVFYTCHRETVAYPTLKFWFDENYPHREAKDEWCADITYGDDYVLVTYEDVKWYQDFGHVRKVNECLDKFIATFDEEEQGFVAWECIEVGEELDDIKRSASPFADWRLDVSRTIHFN